MAIDPTKVLIIVNTNTDTGISPASPSMAGYPTIAAASLANADYYATARGLRTNGNYLKIGFNFGSLWNSPMTPSVVIPTRPGQQSVDKLLPAIVTTIAGVSTAYNALPLLAAIAQFCTDNAVEAILVECNVPPCIWIGHQSGYADYIPTETLLSFSPTYKSGVVPSAPSFVEAGQGAGTAIYPSRGLSTPTMGLTAARTTFASNNTKLALPGFASGNLLSGTFPKSNLMQLYKKAQLAVQIPNGRIGYPGATSADVQRIVTDAIWAEQQDNRAKSHLIGGRGYPSTPNEPYDNVTSNYLFASNGFTNLSRFGPQGYAEYTGAVVDTTAWETGTLSTTAFAVLFGGGSQDPRYYLPEAKVIANYQNGYSGGESGFSFIYKNHTPMRGGWGFAWQSSAYMLGMCVITKGGCTAVCNVMEPYVQGLPDQLEFTTNLLSGLSMMESVYLSAGMTAPRTTVYGDPLYSPYKLTAVSPNEFLL